MGGILLILSWVYLIYSTLIIDRNFLGHYHLIFSVFVACNTESIAVIIHYRLPPSFNVVSK